MTQLPLSHRALAMLGTAFQSRKPLASEDVSQALAKIGCLPIESFISFLSRYGGLCYWPFDVKGERHFKVQFSALSSERPLDLQEIIVKENNEWLLDLGEHYGMGPGAAFLDSSGKIVWDDQIPIHSSIERLIESDALEHTLEQVEGTWLWVKGKVQSDAPTVLDQHPHLQKVAEASDEWCTWWVGDGFFVRHFLSWEVGERPRVLWIYANGSSRMFGLLQQVRSVFVGTPVLRGWPFDASEKDRNVW